ncbi:hypothetical protein AB0942_17170 [Streptomyces nodosus]|uniref:hypothetical protein n=1 Tax=Streptomyces nodosus TaxID=40318 RepID=UPI003453A10F
MLEQQLDQLVNLCGAVDPSGDVDLHCPGRATPDGRFEGCLHEVPVEALGGMLKVDPKRTCW